VNDNDKYPQLTAFLANYILPENAASLPRQAYVSKDGKRKQTEYQPYILTSAGGQLQPVVICWDPKQGSLPMEFTMSTWRSAPLVEGHRIVTVSHLLPSDVVIDLDLANGWSVRFIVPDDLAEASLSW
jgi:hypothetical protein